MSKLVPLKDFGIPVPSPAPAGTDHLIVYYGPHGFTPSYAQADRIDAGAVSGLTVKTVNGIAYYDDPISAQLPAGLASGEYDFVFTLADANGNEGNFSPAITVAVDTAVPPSLGQPIEL